MTRTRRASSSLAACSLVVFGGAVQAGCGAAPPPAAAPAAPAAMEEAPTADAALAAFDRAERSVNELLGPTPRVVVAQQAGAAAAPLAPPPPPPPPAAPKGKESARAADAGPRDKSPEAPPLAASDDRLRHSAQPPSGESCTTACSALASMARAAEHLCGLAGATDSRCVGARERLKSASTRVHASCPGCSS